MSVIYIFRRDFRFHDNTSLIKAIHFANKNNLSLVPIFIFTNNQLVGNKYFSQKCFNFMIESLEDLNGFLNKQYKTKLYLFYGNEFNIIKKITALLRAHAIFYNKDLTQYAINRDKKIVDLFKTSSKIIIESDEDYTILPIGSIKNASNKIYTKFTPYYREFLKRVKKSKNAPNVISTPILKKPYKKSITNEISFTHVKKKFKYTRDSNVIMGGRINALKILKQIKKFKNYAKTKNDLSDFNGTTHLSAYLKFGTISIREFYFSVIKAFSYKCELLRQLIWREFYYNVGFIDPKALYSKTNILGNNIKIQWSMQTTNVKKLFDGRTGFPLIDASVRQIKTTGYMHNRMRLIFASFLTKLVRVKWVVGEKFFAKHLVDYDPIINNQNWQWVTGTGVDVRQAFIVFNPWLQSKKYDKNAEYIKYWIPELKDVPANDIHNWYEKYEKYPKIYIKPMLDYEIKKKEYLKRIT